MKIICIGRNYGKHAAELGNAVPSEPVIFLKPATALTVNGKPFFLPDFSVDVHYELELVLRITKHGKAIEERFANRYYDSVGLGIDFTARDVQDRLKAAGLPWEKAKAFDGSAAVGEFRSLDALADRADIPFELYRNGQLAQQGASSEMLFGFDRLISETSRYFKLMKGDLLFTGTPAGVAAVDCGDHLEGYLFQEKLLDMRVK